MGRQTLLVAAIVLFSNSLRGQTAGESGVLRTSEAKVEEARSSFQVNELNLENFLVQIDGKHLTDEPELLFATEWRNLVLKLSDIVLSEKKLSPLHGRRVIARKAGVLRTLDGTYIIAGLRNDSEVSKFKPDEGYKLDLAYDTNPLEAIFHMPNGVAAGDASVLGGDSPLLDRELLASEINDKGVKGTFAISKKHRIYQVIEFTENLGFMPTKVEVLYGDPKPGDSTEGAAAMARFKDLHTLCVTKIVWSEPRKNLFTPALMDMEYRDVRSELKMSMQMKCTWYDVSSIDPKILSPEFLQSRHRSEDFTLAAGMAQRLDKSDEQKTGK
jgi:hypothetical protein